MGSSWFLWARAAGQWLQASFPAAVSQYQVLASQHLQQGSNAVGHLLERGVCLGLGFHGPLHFAAFSLQSAADFGLGYGLANGLAQDGHTLGGVPLRMK